MEKINFIIRTNFDRDGITEAIISELKKRFELGKGIVLDCNPAERPREKGIEYWGGEHIVSHDAVKFHEKTCILEPEILEKMLPYKSMAMHIMMRECNYDIYDRHYLETVYYRHLSFWLAVFEEYNINCIISMTTPHHIGEYIIYALAQIKNIPYVFLYPQISSGGILFGLGTSFEKLGESIDLNFAKKCEIGWKAEQLSPYMQRAYNSAKNSVIMQSSNAERLYRENKRQFLQFVSLRNRLLDVVKMSVIAVSRESKGSKIIHLNNIKRRFQLRIKAKNTEKKLDHLREYKRYSKEPDYSLPYVYYALQMTPEASTMPLAGEYKEQLLSIEILSKLATELGFQVYVKEHWIQVHRDKNYYKTISELPNVSLIDIKTNSIELINNALAVATQTGNVIFESLVKQKPAIVFGSGYLFKGAPNVIQMTSYGQLKDEMQKVISHSFKIDEKDSIKYLKAMEEEMVFSYTDSLDETTSQYNKSATAKKIVEYFVDNAYKKKGAI